MSDERVIAPDGLRAHWAAAWPAALMAWSRYTQLSEPRWCMTAAEEAEEYLSGSFAMIRLTDHAVVISLRQVAGLTLNRFAVEILAHEIGHHVYCPGDLSDNARLLARTRAGLPTREALAPWVANVYTDILINDRLQRANGMDMAAIYRAVNHPAPDRFWTLYMRIYECLWNLQRGSLALGETDARLDADATLGARLVRSYAKDWLDGAGRFSCLCLPYLLEDEGRSATRAIAGWHDTREAGRGGMPEGLVEIDEEELDGAIHPSEDPGLSGLNPSENAADKTAAAEGIGVHRASGAGGKGLKRLRQPFEYAEIIKACGSGMTEEQIVARYYREAAMPHLIRFPSREAAQLVDPYPEGTDPWDIGQPIDDIDWVQTVIDSPVVIPGFTTRQRLYGTSPGSTPERNPIDLYLGVDCSGSMGNPANHLSYPVLAGAIVALSALRAGSRVMVVLSGEPGQTVATDGFTRDERLILGTLTRYLGTGTTFGIHRLADTFAQRRATERPVHILIVTDNDIFPMLGQRQPSGEGWTVAREALRQARGGGTMVLQLPEYLLASADARAVVHPGCERLRADGWTVANIDSLEGLLQFARRFSQAAYAPAAGGGARR